MNEIASAETLMRSLPADPEHVPDALPRQSLVARSVSGFLDLSIQNRDDLAAFVNLSGRVVERVGANDGFGEQPDGVSFFRSHASSVVDVSRAVDKGWFVMGNTRAVHEGWCDSNAACNCGCDAYEPDFEGIATTLVDALRDVTDALGELVVVKGGVTPTIVAPQMNDLTEPFNRARAALGEFDRVSGSLKEG